MKTLVLVTLLIPTNLLATPRYQYLSAPVVITTGKYRGSKGLLIFRDRATEECVVLISRKPIITLCGNIKVRETK